jgi:hypothetical protein
MRQRPDLKGGVMSGIRDTGTKGRSRNRLRPAVVSLAVVVVVAVLSVMLPGSINGGGSVLARVVAAAEEVRSYRMEITITGDEILYGETSETSLNYTYEFISDRKSVV